MKLLLADDHALFREGFSMIINSSLVDSKIYPANSWNEVITMAKQQHFDLALLDLFMPGTKAWDKELSTFLTMFPKVPVCVVSGSNNQSHITQAFKLGVKGFIRKTSSASEVAAALSRLMKGERYVPQSNWQSLPVTQATASLTLTWRQEEILRLIAEGSSNKAISIQLDITENTVKRHVYNLFKALNAKSRIDAIQIAKNLGILTN